MSPPADGGAAGAPDVITDAGRPARSETWRIYLL